MTFLSILVLIVVTESITELLVKSDIFNPIRKFLFERKENFLFGFLSKLFDCGYCMSVWVGFLNMVMFYFLAGNKFYIIFILAIFLHRLSNLLHFIIDRFDRSKTY